MNEALIKNVIQLKLTAAGKILDQLPSEMSDSLKNLGKIILEGINESSQKTKNRPVNKNKSEDKLNSIKIE